MTIAVLRVEHQKTEQLPNCCVVSGERTDTAVHAWAVESRRVDWVVGLAGHLGVLLAKLTRRQVMKIALPVTERALGSWRRRESLSLAIIGFGLALVVIGIVQPDSWRIGVGVGVGLLGVAVRARAFWNYWVSAELRPDRAEIVIRRASDPFGAEAKRLFVRSLRPRL